MTGGIPQAFGMPNQIFVGGANGTSFTIQLSCLAGDGSGCPVGFCMEYVYDMSQGAAANLAALKTAVFAQAQQFFPNITECNVVLFTAVN